MATSPRILGTEFLPARVIWEGGALSAILAFLGEIPNIMKTIPFFLASFALALAVTSPIAAQDPGTMPDFADATWFNTPAFSSEDMQGRAVMVEVFRTW